MQRSLIRRQYKTTTLGVAKDDKSRISPRFSVSLREVKQLSLSLSRKRHVSGLIALSPKITRIPNIPHDRRESMLERQGRNRGPMEKQEGVAMDHNRADLRVRQGRKGLGEGVGAVRHPGPGARPRRPALRLRPRAARRPGGACRADRRATRGADRCGRAVARPPGGAPPA
jgi:hypothetical protein